jgi:hypothetical protein
MSSYLATRYRFSSGSLLLVDDAKRPRHLYTRAYWFITDRLLSRSPQIRACTFFALLHHLPWPLDHVVSSSCANSPLAYASYDVLVHQLANLLAASSGPILTEKPGQEHKRLKNSRYDFFYIITI